MIAIIKKQSYSSDSEESKYKIAKASIDKIKKPTDKHGESTDLPMTFEASLIRTLRYHNGTGRISLGRTSNSTREETALQI